MKDDRTFATVIVCCVLAGLALAFLISVPPITQNQDYHVFADQRAVLGIRNFWNVISNLVFAVVGILGLRRHCNAPARVLFGGLLLTCFGSAYYHLEPSDARLVWDRLPMTFVFTSLVAEIVSEQLLAPLVIGGTASVLWWHAVGDLRPYLIVQFGSMLILLLAVCFVKRLRGLWPMLALYVLAKLAETYDRPIYQAISLSGHTWKHVLASLAGLPILRKWPVTSDRSLNFRKPSRQPC